MNSVDFAIQSSYEVMNSDPEGANLILSLCIIALLIPMFVHMWVFSRARNKERRRK